MKISDDFLTRHFTGSTLYYEHQLLNRVLLLSEGCNFVRQEGEANWLFDCILSHQFTPILQEEVFQSWTLQKLEEGNWRLSCEDGNGKLLCLQTLPTACFPLSTLQMFVVDGVCLLASEY